MMWSNLSGVVGAVVQRAQNLSAEIESQLDEAVGKERQDSAKASPASSSSAQGFENSTIDRVVSADGAGSSANEAAASIAAEGEFSTVDINDSAHIVEAKTVAAEPAPRKAAGRKPKPKVSPSPSASSLNGDASPIAAAEPTNGNHRVSPSAMPIDRKEIEDLERHYQAQLTAMRQSAEESGRRSADLAANHKTQLEHMQQQHAKEKEDLLEAQRKAAQEYEGKLSVMKSECDERVQQCLSAGDTKDQMAALTSSYEEKLKRSQQEAGKAREDCRRLGEELQRNKEIVSERERALESVNVKMSETNSLYEQAQVKLRDLQNEIAEKDRLLKATQLASADDQDTRRLLAKLQEQIAEKDGKLAAFENEGQQLAKKQSEMEKNIRKNRNEMKEKEAEIAKLKESKDQLVKAIEQTQDVLKKQETDNANNAKSLQAMQAVSAASADKISKLEAELSAKNDDLIGQRKALENCWAEINEYKKLVAELKGERDDLKKQLGEGTSRVLETESSRRDVEQREAVLRATSKQLEDSLRQQMQEKNVREEQLRMENQNMQKRWQEAIMGREQLANELSQVTTPLLRQITSLQDQLRIKSDQFISIETSLNERVLKAENSVEVFEHKKALLDEQIAELKAQHSALSAQHKESLEKISNYEAALEKYRKMESGFVDERRALESKLAYEMAQNKSIQVTLKELEIKYKLELQEAHDSLHLSQSQHSMEVSKLKSEASILNELLKSEKNKSNRNTKNLVVSIPVDGDDPRMDALPSTLPSESFYPCLALHLPCADTLLTDGEISFVAAEKQLQRQRQRGEELSGLQRTIVSLENTRDALMEEVSTQSSRNSQLTDELDRLRCVHDELSAAAKQRDVLLVLLGEKEEELEAAVTDMAEVKCMYQSHIQELLDKLTPALGVPPH